LMARLFTAGQVLSMDGTVSGIIGQLSMAVALFQREFTRTEGGFQ